MDPSLLSSLTLSDIVTPLPDSTFTSIEKCSQPKLEDTICSLPCEYVQVLTDCASSKRLHKVSELEQNALLLTNPTFYHSVCILLMKEITNRLPLETFTCQQRRSCASLEDMLVGASMEHQEQLLNIVAAKTQKWKELCTDPLDGAV